MAAARRSARLEGEDRLEEGEGVILRAGDVGVFVQAEGLRVRLQRGVVDVASGERLAAERGDAEASTT